MSSDVLVEFRDLVKEFSGTRALNGVSLDFTRGEVHGLLGENGAGKSTLIKILTGVYTPSGGEILLEGRSIKVGSPLDAHKLGLGAVYQDAELVNGFTVGQNVLLGNEHRFFVSSKALHDEARGIFEEIGIEIDVERKASTLSAAEMQLVTLATLFHRKYKLIVLDEPTARLSGKEVELLFALITRFLEQGITIVYISHRLGEIKRICDRVTILRGGNVSATLLRDEISEDRVTELMVDRSRADLDIFNDGIATDRVVLEVDGMRTQLLKPLSFKVRAGEVLGITGPVGGGMEQVEMALGGIVDFEGMICVNGKAVDITNPPASRHGGIALIPADRRKQALFPNLTVAENICLPVLDLLSRFGLIQSRREVEYADSVMQRLAVHPNKPTMAVKFFSGGNQQKAVIGKWLKAGSEVYIFVEPTSGVDVGAIKEIYDVILNMARGGVAVIVISSSVKEVLSLAETVFVIHDGDLVHEAPKSECTYDQLLAIAMQGRVREAAE